GQIECELGNARAALGWFVERGDVERGLGLMTLLWHFLREGGLEREARAWSDRFLARPEAGQPSVRKAACWAAGVVAWTRGDFRAAQARSAEGLPLARAEGDVTGTEWFLGHLALAHREQGEEAAAEALLREIVALARDRGDDADRGPLVPLGDSARLRGDDD